MHVTPSSQQQHGDARPAWRRQRTHASCWLPRCWPAPQIEALAGPGATPTDMPPPVPVVIEAAGELPPGWLADNAVPPVSAGGYPLWPEDAGPPPVPMREAAHRLGVAADLRQQGNDAYKAVRLHGVDRGGAAARMRPQVCRPPVMLARAVWLPRSLHHRCAMLLQGDAATALARYRQALRYLSWTSFKLRLPDGDADLDLEEQVGGAGHGAGQPGQQQQGSAAHRTAAQLSAAAALSLPCVPPRSPDGAVGR